MHSQRTTGISNPKCYLSFTKNCADKISGEHVISANLLDKLAPQKKTVPISGLKWISPGQTIHVGKKSLVANCLCTTHNSQLAPLDTEAGKFFSTIEVIERSKSRVDRSYRIDGALLERWMLKTIIGAISSGNTRKLGIREKLFQLLLGSLVRWPTGWGMYFSNAGAQRLDSNFSMVPKYNQSSGELMAVGSELHGVRMCTVFDRPPPQHGFGIRRPSKLIFRSTDATSEILFTWGADRGKQTVEFTENASLSLESLAGPKNAA